MKKMLDYQTDFDNPQLDENELVVLVELPKNGGEWIYETYEVSDRFLRVLYSLGSEKERFQWVSESIADPDPEDFALVERDRVRF